MVRFDLEQLEARQLLSLVFEHLGEHHDDHDHDCGELHAEAAKGGNGGGGKTRIGPAIRLDLVALHEFGHSLGLDHSSDPNSIMYSYYNADYDLGSFASDSVVAAFQALYGGTNTPWKDANDPNPNNGTIEVTYGFMPDGTKLESRTTNTIFTKLNALYGSPSVWQQIFTDQLDRWESVSNGKLSFLARSDAGRVFNYLGSSQNDAYSGDIRIGAHKMDGPSRTIAHAYFPPPNGSTAAGDLHLDDAENWDGMLSGGSLTTSRFSTQPLSGSAAFQVPDNGFHFGTATGRPAKALDTFSRSDDSADDLLDALLA